MICGQNKLYNILEWHVLFIMDLMMYLPEGHFFKNSLAGASRQVHMSDPTQVFKKDQLHVSFTGFVK